MTPNFNPSRPKEKPRTYHWKSRAKGPSQHFDFILDGAVRQYPDGREVCQNNSAGRIEYSRRLNLMLRRQNWICCLCGKGMNTYNATFEHRNPRGMAGARRDDRIEDENGLPMNGAAHWTCNGEKGSKRI